MAQAPDLFVVCKSCKAEVSPYITECPYCGTRLRKRAPKIERDGTVSEPRSLRRRAAPPPAAPKPRRRPRAVAAVRDGRPWVTIALVVLSLFGGFLLPVVNDGDVALVGPVDGDWWKVATSPFLYGSAWVTLACVLPIAVFGWLLERRHGPLVPLLLFVVCGMGGVAVVAAVDPVPVALGGNGAALGLLAAWALPDLLRMRRGEEHEGDLLGTAVLAVVVLLLPAAATEVSAIAGVVGGLVGLLAGLVLARRGA